MAVHQHAPSICTEEHSVTKGYGDQSRDQRYKVLLRQKEKTLSSHVARDYFISTMAVYDGAPSAANSIELLPTFVVNLICWELAFQNNTKRDGTRSGLLWCSISSTGVASAVSRIRNVALTKLNESWWATYVPSDRDLLISRKLQWGSTQRWLNAFKLNGCKNQTHKQRLKP